MLNVIQSWYEFIARFNHAFVQWFIDAFHFFVDLITGKTSLFSAISDIFGRAWDNLISLSIFEDLNVGILYSWIPDNTVRSCLTFVFGFSCVIGVLKFLKSVVPSW